MVTQLADLFPLILVAAGSALVLGVIFVRLAPQLGLMDLPYSAPHKRHEAATPMVGGPVIALALLLTYLALQPPLTAEVKAILLGASLMLIWGVVDDRIGLQPYQKAIGQLAASLVLIALGVQVRITRIPWLDITLSVLWFVGMTNAFNFVDSMDGLALGLAAVASSFFMLVMIDSGQPVLAQLSATLLGSCVGTFAHNARPARLFLGDSGAQLQGYLLAALGVAYVPAGAGLPQGVSWFTPILVLGVPIFDMSLVTFSRARRRAPIQRANRDHTYHRLLATGLDSTRSVLIMQLAAIMLGLTAFIALDTTVLVANGIFALIVLLGVAAIFLLDRWTDPILQERMSTRSAQEALPIDPPRTSAREEREPSLPEERGIHE